MIEVGIVAGIGYTGGGFGCSLCTPMSNSRSSPPRIENEMDFRSLLAGCYAIEPLVDVLPPSEITSGTAFDAASH